MSSLTLRRTYYDKVTIGKLIGVGVNLVTLELPWKANSPKISCIPEGTYKVTPRYTPERGKHFEVQNVPGRSKILFHPANYASQLEGCIAPGLIATDINKDKILDVTSSRIAMDVLLYRFPNGFELVVTK